jgi:Fur family ferric uptake transcriptional regulator
MSCEAETMQMLRDAGHKLTPQRLMVLSVVRHHRGHLSAAEICERVKRTYPYVDISTVYRTMTILKALRLVNETDLGTGDATFEWAGAAPHHHLICRSCDSIASLDHEFLARLGSDLERAHGLRADLDHFAIFGYCRDCRSEGKDLAGATSDAGDWRCQDSRIGPGVTSPSGGTFIRSTFSVSYQASP